MLKALFIDFDGTLVESLDSLYLTYLEFLETFNIKGTLEEFNQLIGPSIREVVAILQKRYQLNETLQDLNKRYEDLLRKFYAKSFRLYPGTKEFLKESASQWELILVTSAIRELIEPFLIEQQIDAFFVGTITANECSACKPHPEPYLKALEMIQAIPKEALVLEDSKNGILSAQRAGIPFLWIDHSIKNPFFWQDILKKVRSHAGKLSDACL